MSTKTDKFEQNQELLLDAHEHAIHVLRSLLGSENEQIRLSAARCLISSKPEIYTGLDLGIFNHE